MKKRFPYGDDDGYGAVSASECTGLIPSEPLDGDEVRSYSDIYDLPLPQHRTDRREIMNGKKKQKDQRPDGTDSKNESSQDTDQTRNEG